MGSVSTLTHSFNSDVTLLKFKRTMNPKILISTTLVAVAMIAADGMFASPILAQGQPERGIVGRPAPEWQVSQWRQLPAGKSSINIDDYKGKVTYLYFFQSWCPGCHRDGFPTLQALTEKFKDDADVAFVAIQTTFEGFAVNTPEKLEKMAARYALSIPFGQSEGVDATPDIMRKYRSGGTPWVVIIDPQGVVRFDGFHISPDAAANTIEALKQ